MRGRTTQQHLVQRARTVLAAAYGGSSSVDELVAKLMGLIESYNRTAKRFRSTYDGRPLKDRVNHP